MISIETLQEDISRLRELKERMQRVRQVPPTLMKGTEKMGEEFAAVREIGQHVVSDDTQRALLRARDSLAEDGTDVWAVGRREKRKRT